MSGQHQLEQATARMAERVIREPNLRCANCQQPARMHGARDNPIRPFACPGRKEPAWPRTVKDEQRASEIYDRRLAKFWSERSTSFREAI